MACCAWRSYSCWRVSFPVRRHITESDRDSWAEWGQQQQRGCGRRWESAGGEVVLLQHGEWRLDPHAAVCLAAGCKHRDLWRRLWLEEWTTAVCAGPCSRAPHQRKHESLKWSVLFIYFRKGRICIVVNTSLKARCFLTPNSEITVGSLLKFTPNFFWLLDLSNTDKPSCSNFISFTLLWSWPLKCPILTYHVKIQFNRTVCTDWCSSESKQPYNSNVCVSLNNSITFPV